ncbi:hypothetical protein [Micromonospora chalcea]|uniref:hypothetical protein n=1 Tax=Micromonospora chalcea TaxID=1874 RepID=UPI001C708A16|nr:hypothetical protein [Micromonospora chalcea]
MAPKRLADILEGAPYGLPVQELLQRAGYKQETIEDFYYALRQEIQDGSVAESREPDGSCIIKAWRLDP